MLINYYHYNRQTSEVVINHTGEIVRYFSTVSETCNNWNLSVFETNINPLEASSSNDPNSSSLTKKGLYFSQTDDRCSFRSGKSNHVNLVYKEPSARPSSVV